MRTVLPDLRLRGCDFVACLARRRIAGACPSLGAADRREIDAALEMVGARDLAGRPLAEMSGGERQRLLLAQALIGEPRLLLLDEPLISLDPHHQEVVVDLVRRSAATRGSPCCSAPMS